MDGATFTRSAARCTSSPSAGRPSTRRTSTGRSTATSTERRRSICRRWCQWASRSCAGCGAACRVRGPGAPTPPPPVRTCAICSRRRWSRGRGGAPAPAPLSPCSARRSNGGCVRETARAATGETPLAAGCHAPHVAVAGRDDSATLEREPNETVRWRNERAGVVAGLHHDLEPLIPRRASVVEELVRLTVRVGDRRADRRRRSSIRSRRSGCGGGARYFLRS